MKSGTKAKPEWKIQSIQSLIKYHGVMIDDEDLERVSLFVWRVTNQNYVIRSKIDGKQLMLHRFILEPKEDELIDHKDHNTLNNKKSNLRICTRKQNNQNKKILEDKISKGIRFLPDSYEVRIEQKHIGRFSDLDAAKNAYNHFAKQIFGDFAFLNEVDKFMEKEEWEKYRKTYSSQYYGVYYSKNWKKWVAKIRVNQKQKDIGCSSEIEAAKVYNKYLLENNIDKPLNEV